MLRWAMGLKNQIVNTRMTSAMVEALDEWADLAGVVRSEAVRVLVGRGVFPPQEEEGGGRSPPHKNPQNPANTQDP